jgi:hypothetical protein
MKTSTEPVSFKETASKIDILTLDRYAPGMRPHSRTCPETLERALTRRWRDDRHFVAYAPAEVGGACVRLTTRDGADRETGEPIPCVWSLPAGERPAVAMQLLIGDVDPPGHEWTDAWGARTAKRLAQSGMAHYRTRNGYRVIVPLESPVPLESESDAAEWSELYLAWVASVKERYGIELDPACKDWTRLYRLPNVRRDGKDERAEVIGELTPMPASELSALIDAMAEATPAPARAPRKRSTAGDDGAAIPVTSGLLGEAARMEAFRIANEAPPSIAGCGGDAALFRASMAIAEALGVEAEDHGAILPYLEIFSRRCEPPWDRAKLDYEARGRAADVRGSLVRMRARLRELRELRAVNDNANDAFRLADGADAGESQPLLLGSKDGKALLIYAPRDGYRPIARDMLIPEIRALGLESLLPIADGKREFPPAKIISRHAVGYRHTKFSYGPETTYDPAGEGTVTIGLRVPEIAPVFDPAVDRWLRAMGGERYPRLEQWIASCAQKHNDRLAAALVLIGPASLGKGLLVETLAKMWGETAAPARASTLLAQFNSRLLQSPIVFDDEGVLVGSRELSSDEFRTLTAERSRDVEPKGKERCQLLGTLRLAIAVNNRAQLKLTNLDSADTLAAVGLRLLEIDMASRAGQVASALAALELEPGSVDVARIRGHLAWMCDTVEIKPCRFIGGGEGALAPEAAHVDTHRVVFDAFERWLEGDCDVSACFAFAGDTLCADPAALAAIETIARHSREARTFVEKALRLYATGTARPRGVDGRRARMIALDQDRLARALELDESQLACLEARREGHLKRRVEGLKRGAPLRFGSVAERLAAGGRA